MDRLRLCTSVGIRRLEMARDPTGQDPITSLLPMQEITVRKGEREGGKEAGRDVGREGGRKGGREAGREGGRKGAWMEGRVIMISLSCYSFPSPPLGCVRPHNQRPLSPH